MTYYNEVEKLYQKKSLSGSNLIILDKIDALNFLKECESREIKISGIDGFLIHGNAIQPVQVHSADYSGKDAITNKIYAIATEFIKSRPDNIYFEIVCSR
jgi:hypothetical protein